MEISEFEKMYNDGTREVTATMDDGSKMNLRLFVSTYNGVCYYGKGMSRRGYGISRIASRVVSVVPKKSRKNLSVYERYVDALKKFKVVFTKKVHPNLWSGMQDNYKRLDVDAFEKFVSESGCDKNDYWKIHDCFREFAKANNIIDVMWENQYKTTTIKGNAPVRNRYNSAGYYDCLENIKKHIKNKEKFYYSWYSNYDVSVSGYTTETGEYRATMSLEYRGCGNGHYYVLINENQAVFGEDD